MDWLLDRFAEAPDARAFVHDGRVVTYGAVVAAIAADRAALATAGVAPGRTVVVVGDYSPEIVCLILALALNGNVVVPLTHESVVEREAALAICGADYEARLAGEGIAVAPLGIAADNPLLERFRAEGRPGLVLFSSGSTGTPKAILHDFARVADKFRVRRAPMVAIPFLMLDHFGGINTILAITSSLGTVVTVRSRSVASVCEAIARDRVELLPATPSFLTMMIASGAARTYDLTSLTRITYGTEVMPQVTLDRLRALFPGVELQQTYGLSEVGVLRSQSRPDGSLWVRIGGEGFKTKVVDGVLWIKSDYAMVGYLNAPSEFDADGWFNTKDRVEVDGEYVRILGRVTDIINVGGQKVYPAEVEEVVLGLDNVRDVAVYGEPNPMLGQIVVAKVTVAAPEPLAELKARVRKACQSELSGYKVPAKVVIADGALTNVRQKKERRA